MSIVLVTAENGLLSNLSSPTQLKNNLIQRANWTVNAMFGHLFSILRNSSALLYLASFGTSPSQHPYSTHIIYLTYFAVSKFTTHNSYQYNSLQNSRPLHSRTHVDVEPAYPPEWETQTPRTWLTFRDSISYPQSSVWWSGSWSCLSLPSTLNSLTQMIKYIYQLGPRNGWLDNALQGKTLFYLPCESRESSCCLEDLLRFPLRHFWLFRIRILQQKSLGLFGG